MCGRSPHDVGMRLVLEPRSHSLRWLGHSKEIHHDTHTTDRHNTDTTSSGNDIYKIRENNLIILAFNLYETE